jgi:phosphotransferase system HPr (HPr) family protein
MSRSSEGSAVTAVVTLPWDLHARPAGRLARAAAGFRSAITIASGDRAVDARSVLMVMGLGATKETDLTIRAEGEDASDAVEAIANILTRADEATPVPGP